VRTARVTLVQAAVDTAVSPGALSHTWPARGGTIGASSGGVETAEPKHGDPRAGSTARAILVVAGNELVRGGPGLTGA